MSEIFDAYVRRVGRTWEISIPDVGITLARSRADVRSVAEGLIRAELNLHAVEVRLRWTGDYDT